MEEKGKNIIIDFTEKENSTYKDQRKESSGKKKTSIEKLNPLIEKKKH